MRKQQAVFAAIALGCALAGSALATSAKVAKSAGRVTFTVDNTSEFTLVCDGKVTGKTKSGKFVDAPMKKVTVPPGKFQMLYVSVDPAVDPFVDGWSDIICVSQSQ